jgi:hypothetical protein
VAKKFHDGNPEKFLESAFPPAHFLFTRWVIPAVCNLRMAVVNGLCYADLFDEKTLSTNLWVLGLSCERIYTNLESLDKLPDQPTPTIKTTLGNIPPELLDMAESVRPKMRIFLR